MTSKVRFAPSPTGLLHVGNARTALVNGLFARRHGGHFLLRFDDTDRERSREDYVDAIRGDLRWLGLEWHEEMRQSDRLAEYWQAFERLRAAGRMYACWETPEELEYKRKRQLARGRPPIYDRAALDLSEAEQERLHAKGRRPHWRFLLHAESAGWDDLVRGRVELRADRMSDPVLVRADGTFLYMLSSVVDDVAFGITHVIRGEDHVANTAVQIQMFQALGANPPSFAHLPLLTDLAGKGLSKRLGSMTLQSLRDGGLEPMAIDCYLARLGTGEPALVRASLDELAADFDIAGYGRSTPKFDEAQLGHLNAQVLHASSFEAVAPQLAALGLARATPAFWDAVRGNLQKLEDARHWHVVCFGEIVPVLRDPEFLVRARNLLPPEPWSADVWKVWTKAVSQATGRRGRELFMPLRLALTGREHGPELHALLPLIGRAKAERRLAPGTALAPAPVANVSAMVR